MAFVQATLEGAHLQERAQLLLPFGGGQHLHERGHFWWGGRHGKRPRRGGRTRT